MRILKSTFYGQRDAVLSMNVKTVLSETQHFDILTDENSQLIFRDHFAGSLSGQWNMEGGPFGAVFLESPDAMVPTLRTFARVGISNQYTRL